MSRHEGVRCDSCLRADFRGKRYKCLVCYDYDLCETCYEQGVTSKVHTVEHAVQCILTPTDFNLYYEGELVDQPQSFTCPMCATMGFSLATLREHVSSEHAENTTHVVCPVCAATPGGNPNYMTGDLAVHLTLNHGRNRDPLDDRPSSRRQPRASQAGLLGVIGSTGQSRRPQGQLPSTITLTPLSPSDTEDVRTTLGPLSQISTGARGTSGQRTSVGSVVESQPFRMGFLPDRPQINTAFQQPDRPRFPRPLPTTTSVYSLLPARFPEPVAVRRNPGFLELAAPDYSRFPLSGLVESIIPNSQQQRPYEPGGHDAIESPARVQRPQRQSPSTVTIPTPPDRESIGPVSGPLSQTSAGARRTSAAENMSGRLATEIQQLRMRVQAARQQLNAAFQQPNRPRFPRPLPPVPPAYTFPLVRLPEPVAVCPKPTLVEPPAPTDDRFLLSRLVEPSFSDSQQQALEVERADRSLFVQELLLSTLAQHTPAPGSDRLCELLKRVVGPAATTRPHLTSTTGQEPNTTSPELAAAASLESTASTSSKIASGSAERAVTEGHDTIHPISLKPTLSSNLETAVVASLGNTPPIISGLTTTKSVEPTAPTTPRPAASTSSELGATSPPMAAASTASASLGSTPATSSRTSADTRQVPADPTS